MAGGPDGGGRTDGGPTRIDGGRTLGGRTLPGTGVMLFARPDAGMTEALRLVTAERACIISPA
jgi:hypothetical protein